jgi:uncharacterized repeat protein (TIGR01451 family)
VATVSIDVAGVNALLVPSKSALVSGVVPIGTTFIYRLGVLNQGPGPATHVVVTDPLPGLVAFVSSSCATSAGGLVTWNVGTLAADQQADCDVTVQALSDGAALNTATIAADDTDPNVDPTTAQATVTIGSAIQVPTLDAAGLGTLALVLLACAWVVLRRRSRGASG